MFSWSITYPNLRLLLDGMLLMMAVYAALSCWQQRKLVYACYAVYISCMVVTFHFDDQSYANPAYQPGISYMVTLIETMAFALYIGCALLLLDFRRYDPFSFRLLRGMLLLLALHVAVDTVLWLGGASVAVRSGLYVIMRLLLAGVALWVVPRVIRLRQPVMIYFVVGAFLFTLGCLMALTANYIPGFASLQPANAFTFPVIYMQIGVVLEVLCFRLGLSLRNLQTERERIAMQAELIRQLQENEARQRQVQRIRADIARDLHDDIGADLSTISMLSLAAGRQLTQQPQEAQATLRLIGEAARQVLKNMRQIVWSLTEAPDTGNAFADRLRDTAQTLFEHHDVKLHLDLPPYAPENTVAPDVKRAVFLTCKELLHNALRHANAQNIWVKLRLQDNSLSLTVSDDGGGFLADQPAEFGSGLRSLRQRATDLRGQFTICSAPGEGASLTLICPLNTPLQQPQPA